MGRNGAATTPVIEKRRVPKQPPAKRINPFLRPGMLGAVSHPFAKVTTA